MTALGSRIQTLRKRQGLSQEQLAEVLQVSRQALSKWELDASAPALEHIILLSQYFGVTADFLLTGKTPPSASSAAPPAFQLVLTPIPPRTAIFIGTILIVLGLFIGLSAIVNGSFAIGLGILFQLSGCGVFQAAYLQAKKQPFGSTAKYPFLFYGINIWLLTPLPLMTILPILLILIRSKLSLALLLMVLVISWLLCAGILSFRWLKKYQRHEQAATK